MIFSFHTNFQPILIAVNGVATSQLIMKIGMFLVHSQSGIAIGWWNLNQNLGCADDVSPHTMTKFLQQVTEGNAPVQGSLLRITSIYYMFLELSFNSMRHSLGSSSSTISHWLFRIKNQ